MAKPPSSRIFVMAKCAKDFIQSHPALPSTASYLIVKLKIGLLKKFGVNNMYFHVDINSYFATMLQQENPALRNKPLGILKASGRTCVIAASKEAKKYGVKTGCSNYEARQLCPEILFVPAAFELYLSSTKRLSQIFHSLCPKVQIFSLDEAFLDMGDSELLMQKMVGNIRSPDLYHAFARLIQRRIKDDLGEWVSCNVGISHNRLLAKMAGEIGPKGSVSEINQGNLEEVLGKVEFSDVCGVGFALERRLKALGVSHPLQINLLDDDTLFTQFGPFWSKELRKIGEGKETHAFTHPAFTSHMQSVGRTTTGYKLCDNEEQIKKTLLNLLEEVTYKIRHMDLAGRSIGIFLSGDNRVFSKQLRLKYYVRHTNEIFDLLYNRVYKNFKRDFSVIRFGVFVGELKPTRDIPLCLLPSFQKNEKIYQAMDAINDRFGLFTLRPATLSGKVMRPEVTGYLGDKIYHKL